MDRDKPNPSVKHTLEDVLKALQDLMRNELAEEQKQAQTPRAIQPRRRPGQPPAVQPEPMPEESGDVVEQEAEPPLLTEIVQTPALSTGRPEASRRSGAVAGGNAAPSQASIDWDAVPVLNDIVALSSALEAERPPASLPAKTDRAGAIAARIAAQLDVELRNAGHQPLTPAIIDKLEHLLRAALADEG